MCWRQFRANTQTRSVTKCEEELAAASPAQDSKIGFRDRSDRFAGEPVKIRRTLTLEGTLQGKYTQDCSRVGRPPRTHSNLSKTKEEQQIMGFKEQGFGDKSKGNKVVDWFCFWLLGCSQSVGALYIYRVGRSCPARNPITDLNLWKSLIALGLYVDRFWTHRSNWLALAGSAIGFQTGQTAWTHRSDRFA